ncbi:MAG: MarR family winged helix-turn-helix transcriptional regulator [Actinomycetota bacterium]
MPERASSSWQAEHIDDHPGDAPFLDHYLPYLLHRADVLLSQRFHDDLLAGGVQMSEWRVLAVLDARGERTISSLTDDTMLPQPTVTHAVARLEERGDVERRRGRDDRRQRIVGLTEGGAAKVSALIAQARARERTALGEAGRTGDELRRLLRDLNRRLSSGELEDGLDLDGDVEGQLGHPDR